MEISPKKLDLTQFNTLKPNESEGPVAEQNNAESSKELSQIANQASRSYALGGIAFRGLSSEFNKTLKEFKEMMEKDGYINSENIDYIIEDSSNKNIKDKIKLYELIKATGKLSNDTSNGLYVVLDNIEKDEFKYKADVFDFLLQEKELDIVTIIDTILHTYKGNADYQKEIYKFLKEEEVPIGIISDIICSNYSRNEDLKAQKEMYKFLKEEKIPIKEITEIMCSTTKGNFKVQKEMYDFLKEKEFPIEIIVRIMRSAAEEDFKAKKEMYSYLKKEGLPIEAIAKVICSTSKEDLKAQKEMYKFLKEEKIPIKTIVEIVHSTAKEDIKIKKEIYSLLKDRSLPVETITGAIYCATEEDLEIQKEICNIIKADNNFPKEFIIPILNSIHNKSKEEIYELFNAVKSIYPTLQKNSINELTQVEKRKLIKFIITIGISPFEDQQIKNKYPLIPTNKEEYCNILPNLVKSLGIDIKPLSEENIEKLNDSLNKLSNIIKDFDFRNYTREKGKTLITQEISTKDFIEKVKELTGDLDENEKIKVYNYFGFELKEIEDQGKRKFTTLIGYVGNYNNGHKMSEIKDEKTKEIIEKLRPIVIKYSEENRVKVDGDNKPFEECLNNILDCISELHTTIGKAQHKTQDFTIDVHSLKVMQGIVKNKEYEKLNESDKKIMLLGALLHDIRKLESNVDKTHPNEGSFDTYFISQKLGLSQNEQEKLYDLIRSHDWLERTNSKEDEIREKALKDTAFDYRNGNSFEMAKIFAEADLKAVKNNGAFYDKFGHQLEKTTSQIKSMIKEIKKTQPFLPLSKIPKASEIKNGDGVYKTDDGRVIIKLNKVKNFEDIGFEKGTNIDNLKLMIHGLNDEMQVATFGTFSAIDSSALLSTSYITNTKSDYRGFKPQGLIVDNATLDVQAAKEGDSGTGYKKDIDLFKQDYLFDGERVDWRCYFPNLVKKHLKISDDEYVEIIDKYKDMSLAEIASKDPKLAQGINTLYQNMAFRMRSYDRQYNEILITRPKIKGVFIYDLNTPSNIGNPVKFLDEEDSKARFDFLQKYAKENDLPIFVFGD